MQDERTTVLIRAEKESTTQGTTTTRGLRRLPPDLLHAARCRLSSVATLYALVYVIAYGVGRFTSPVAAWEEPNRPIIDAIAASCIAVSIGVIVLARRIEAKQALDFGLVYMVVGALGIDAWWILHNITPDLQLHGISWACVWIASFPAIVPNSPRRVLIASVIAASMLPLCVFLSLQRGGTTPSAAFLLNWFLPNYLSAGIAYFVAQIVTNLGRDVRRAREMGSYRLVELLGRGGMGEVWSARHRMLARPAAIKLIRAEALGMSSGADTALRRFEREAQATAALHSPHTVELYDFGVTDDGVFFYVMELLDGLDLETLVERHGPLPPERVVHVLTQVCDSLADAHHAGLVHRDIKPANVYVCRSGIKYDVAKVLDFGLVKPTSDGHAASDAKLTVEGIAAGTPAFIAPEMGLGNEIDGRADIYSLGCVAYWLLTGQLVFDSKNPMQMVVDHVHTPATPPSLRTELAIPEPLERLVMACLEKEPAKRPQSAQELAHGLAACQLPQSWTQERAEHWWSIHEPQNTAGVDAAEEHSASPLHVP